MVSLRIAAIVVLVSSCLGCGSDGGRPAVRDDALGDEVAAALRAFNPRFEIRSAEEYTPTVRAVAAASDRTPFMLHLDLNRDGVVDFVVDGHDDRQSMLVGLLSEQDGYRVIVIRTGDLLEPQEIESWSDGVKQTGLHYSLWPNGETGFTLAFPQQSAADGTLLNDGVMIDYSFSDDVFTAATQVL